MKNITVKPQINKPNFKYIVEGKLTLLCGTVEWKPLDLTNDPNWFTNAHPEYDLKRIRFKRIEEVR